MGSIEINRNDMHGLVEMKVKKFVHRPN